MVIRLLVILGFCVNMAASTVPGSSISSMPPYSSSPKITGGSRVGSASSFGGHHADGKSFVKIKKSTRKSSFSGGKNTLKFFFDVESHLPHQDTQLKPTVNIFKVAECHDDDDDCIPPFACSNEELTVASGFGLTVEPPAKHNHQSYCGSVDLRVARKRTDLFPRFSAQKFACCVRVAVIDSWQFVLFQDEQIFDFNLSDLNAVAILTTAKIWTQNVDIRPPITVKPVEAFEPEIFPCKQYRHGSRSCFERIVNDEAHRSRANQLITLCIVGKKSHTKVEKIEQLKIHIDRKSCSLCGHNRLCPLGRDIQQSLTLLGDAGSFPLMNSHARTQIHRDQDISLGYSGSHCSKTDTRIGFGVYVRLRSDLYSGCQIQATVKATIVSTASTASLNESDIYQNRIITPSTQHSYSTT